MMERPEKEIHKTLNSLTTLMSGLGLVMMAFGAFCLTDIETVGNYVSFDARTLTVMAWTLIITGIGIVSAPYIEKMKSRDPR